MSPKKSVQDIADSSTLRFLDRNRSATGLCFQGASKDSTPEHGYHSWDSGPFRHLPLRDGRIRAACHTLLLHGDTLLETLLNIANSTKCWIVAGKVRILIREQIKDAGKCPGRELMMAD